jgi:uncharacterized membrane protein YhaH (DUF805 family)
MRNLLDRFYMYAASLLLAGLVLFSPKQAMAVDVLGEYSYMHVSFSSVWHLFLFILILVMMPFILLIFHAWKQSNRKGDPENRASETKEGDEQI